jgi:hypothetical protein
MHYGLGGHVDRTTQSDIDDLLSGLDGQSEISNFADAGLINKDICNFKIAMYDTKL